MTFLKLANRPNLATPGEIS